MVAPSPTGSRNRHRSEVHRHHRGHQDLRGRQDHVGRRIHHHGSEDLRRDGMSVPEWMVDHGVDHGAVHPDDARHHHRHPRALQRHER